MADTDNKPTPTPTPAKEKVAVAEKAIYPDKKVKEIEVETSGDFQLYDPVSQTLYAADETVTRPENDQFVVTNIERGKLKKVK